MNEEYLNPGTTGLTVNESMKADLLCAAKWAKFLCIMACIGMGLMVLLGIMMFFLGSALANAANAYPMMPLGGSIGFLYLIIVAIYIYPIVKGFQFANGTFTPVAMRLRLPLSETSISTWPLPPLGVAVCLRL